ncbi:BTAD domain-containing putative transcriptional regulator [Streptomyces sp. CA-179760]|uniref:BTAD domain-containing putative transcriptional regulator n=1 Tax=Streptomyces sp. CA-179760 TaxID=3240054 RepID=UPI003D907CA9
MGGTHADKAEGPLRFALLGPVRAWRGEQALDLGAPRQRSVAAALLLHANRPVTREQLVRAVWGESAPAYAVNQLQKYVSALRRVLEPEREARAPSGVLNWSDSGYVIEVEPDGVDLTVFEHAAARGRGALARGDVKQTAAELRGALDLWHGPPLANVSSDVLDAERDRLQELRATVLEERIQADLDLGRHQELVPELTRLAAGLPFREGVAAMLMLALYRSSRQSDALSAYQRIRRNLREELGVDPGRELQELHGQILVSAPSLSWSGPTRWRGAGSTAAEPPTTVTPAPDTVQGLRQLPMDIPEFVGREAELRELWSCAGDRETAADAGNGGVVIAVIEGMAGVGKTRLAVHAAHQFVRQGHFADVQLWADLKGFSSSRPPADPADVLEDFLRLLGVPGSQIPAGAEARSALYRDRMTGKRSLVVLDDAVDEEHVRLLLPGEPSCMLLVTSRRVLSGLDGAHTIRLGTFSPEEALALVARVLGRTADEPGSEDARRVVELSGRLPLAVALVARRLRTRPTWNVSELAKRLETAEERLRQFTVGRRTVDDAFEPSYRSLPADLRRAFRLLALHPGEDFTPSSAGALLGQTRTQAEQQVESLLDEHLLQQHAVGRYRYHDLLRLYALELARTEDDQQVRRTAVRRLVDWHCRAAEAARHALEPWRRHLPGHGHGSRPGSGTGDADRAPADLPASLSHPVSALRWVEQERSNLLAVSREAAGRWHHDTWRLATAAHAFLAQHSYGTDSREGLRLGLEAARRMSDSVKQAQSMRDLGGMYDGLGRHEESAAQHHVALALSEGAGDVRGAAEALSGLGRTSYALGRYPQSAEQHRRALSLFTKIADRHGQARSHGGLGTANWFIPGRFHESTKGHRRATALFTGTGDFSGQAHEASNLGLAHWVFGNYTQCARYHGRALALFQRGGDLRGQAIARHGLGLAAWHLGHPDAARDHHLFALDVFRKLSDRRGTAISLQRLGYVQWTTGRYHEGEDLLRQALTLGTSIGNRQTEAWALASLGFLCQRLNRIEEGHEHLRKALEVAQTIGDPHCESSAVLGLALTDLSAGRIDRCTETAERALAQSRNLSNPHGEALALFTLGLASGVRSQPHEGAAWHRAALGLARRTAEPFTESTALTGLGSACTALGHYAEAERHLNTALTIRQHIADRHGQADTLMALADLETATGRPRAATSSRAHALTILTEIGAPAG